MSTFKVKLEEWLYERNMNDPIPGWSSTIARVQLAEIATLDAMRGIFNLVGHQ